MTTHIGFLAFPDVTQLDLTGPAQVLSRVPGATVHLVWKTLEPVATDAGFALVPTQTLETCPPLDVLCVPGGGGVGACMKDEQVLGWLRRQSEGARYVTSVCTGSLVLAAAGLLEGYDSACHWAFRELLTRFGARPVAARVVRDRNRLSGGGVTAGIDFGLSLAADLSDPETARMIQLGLEYDPQPPFDCGSPESAGPERVARFRERIRPALAARLALIDEISASPRG
ncbi:MAG: DJ-1/PfpI family protein [Myxococcales bacterium]|nr:MAG: DJ-1/PfpI family protein [Myxococcales bacterium]